MHLACHDVFIALLSAALSRSWVSFRGLVWAYSNSSLVIKSVAVDQMIPVSSLLFLFYRHSVGNYLSVTYLCS